MPRAGSQARFPPLVHIVHMRCRHVHYCTVINGEFYGRIIRPPAVQSTYYHQQNQFSAAMYCTDKATSQSDSLRESRAISASMNQQIQLDHPNAGRHLDHLPPIPRLPVMPKSTYPGPLPSCRWSRPSQYWFLSLLLLPRVLDHLRTTTSGPGGASVCMSNQSPAG